MRTLFTNQPLTDSEPMSLPAYSYLNTSSRASICHRRKLIDSWFAHYPDEAKPKLIGAFQSKNNNQHQAGFFELLIHEIFVQQDYKVQVTDLQPDNKLPDFFMTRKDGYQFYVEVCNIFDCSESKTGEQQRLYRFHDYVNDKMRSEDFVLTFGVTEVGAEDLPSRDIVARLTSWLHTLSYDDEMSKKTDYSNGLERPTQTFVVNGWNINFQVWTKIQERRQDDGRIIKLWDNTKGGCVDDYKQLAASVVKKTKYYGDLHAPLLIATNSTSPFAELETAVWGLFGLPKLMGNRGSGQRPALSCAGGAWLSKKRNWMGQKASAIMHVSQCSALKVFGAHAAILYHPEPKYELDSILPGLDQIRVIDGDLEYPERDYCTELSRVLQDDVDKAQLEEGHAD